MKGNAIKPDPKPDTGRPIDIVMRIFDVVLVDEVGIAAGDGARHIERSRFIKRIYRHGDTG